MMPRSRFTVFEIPKESFRIFTLLNPKDKLNIKPEQIEGSINRNEYTWLSSYDEKTRFEVILKMGERGESRDRNNLRVIIEYHFLEEQRRHDILTYQIERTDDIKTPKNLQHDMDNQKPIEGRKFTVIKIPKESLGIISMMTLRLEREINLKLIEDAIEEKIYEPTSFEGLTRTSLKTRAALVEREVDLNNLFVFIEYDELTGKIISYQSELDDDLMITPENLQINVDNKRQNKVEQKSKEKEHETGKGEPSKTGHFSRPSTPKTQTPPVPDETKVKSSTSECRIG